MLEDQFVSLFSSEKRLNHVWFLKFPAKKKCIQTVPGISGVSAAWIPTKQIKVELQRQRLSWKMSLAKGDAQRVPQNVKWIQIEFSQVEFSQVGIYIKERQM